MAYSIQNLKPRHYAIADWLVANPDATLRECAAAFGLSPVTVTNLVHTDSFQEYLSKRRDVAFHHVLTLREKIVGLSHEAITRLHEKIQCEEDPQMLLQCADKMLNKLGYGQTSAAPQTTNVQVNLVDAEALEAARNRVRRLYADDAKSTT